MTKILITGASRGMGANTAQRLAERGCTVFAGVRNPHEYAERLHADQTLAALDIRPIRLDVTDDASVSNAVATVRDSFDSIDVVINNAGVPGTWADAEEVGTDDFADVFATNVLGPVRVTRAFLPLLLKGDSPRLVMVSSGMGSLTRQSQDPVYRDIAHLPYPASKAALNMLTVQYTKALPGILVTAVDPGLTATEFTGGAGHTVEEGTDAIVTAALDTHGTSGRFIDRNGETSW